MYFNYHAKIRRLINENKATGYSIVNDWNGIKPALVIYFENNPPMPIRLHKWGDYLPILERLDIKQIEVIE